MSPEDCARLLAIAGTYDNRITPPTRSDAQARSIGWSKALDHDMNLEFAIEAIIDHYANETNSLMPAHINRAWRAHRKAEAERRHAITAIPDNPDAIPMPESFKAELHRLMSGTMVE